VIVQGAGNVSAGFGNFVQAVRRDPDPPKQTQSKPPPEEPPAPQPKPQKTQPVESPQRQRAASNQAKQEELVRNQQKQVKEAIDKGGASEKGRVLDKQGRTAEDLTNDTLQQVEKEMDGVQVRRDRSIASGEGSEIDNLVTRGNKTVYVENKFTIASINKRMINQLTNATKAAKPGDTVVLQVTRTPTATELKKLQAALGDEVFKKIKIETSQVDLFDTVTSALK
jgi:hypothetical protein